jgi:16S rRNA (guanine(966)-N(2))-methyltransferase RsmD
MRVVAGIFRGRRLGAPTGRDVRPTPDRVREALFDILGATVRGCRFLDLFAGSGANGIEALSRGAERSVFVESERAALASLESNLASLGLSDEFQICRTPWPSALSRIEEFGPYELVFADPPYAAADYRAILESLGGWSALAPDARVIVEHEARTELPVEAGGLFRTRTARYGNVALDFYSHR